MKKSLISTILLVLAASLVQSCSPAVTPGVTLVPQEQVNTSVAGTVAVLETRIAGIAQTAEAVPTATLEPSSTPTAKTTALTVTAAPATTGGSGCLDMMSFEGDVTIPDDTIIPPGTIFTKTWAIKNTGFCTWDKNYSIVFTSGDQLGGTTTPLVTDGVVRPGETARVSLRLVAPDATGDRVYTGFWKLRNPNGAIFGWGDNGSRSFYVKIKVDKRFEFVNNIYSASWSNNDGAMFGSTEGSAAGYFGQEKSPSLENGLTGGPSLVMIPPQRQDGFIQAKFMPLKVPNGTYIRGQVGCAYAKENCNYRATILASVDGGEEKEIGSIMEYYDGLNPEFNISLDRFGLVGQQVRFTFRVETNGGPEGDVAYWQGIYLGE